MLSDEQRKRVGEKLRLFQLVPLCMILFVSGFAIFVSQISDRAIATGPAKLLTTFAVFAAFAMFTLACFIPRVFSGKRDLKAETDDVAVDSAFNIYAVETMIRFALLLAAAFINLLVFFVEPHIGSLVAAGLGTFLMIIFFPRKSKVASIIGKQIETA